MNTTIPDHTRGAIDRYVKYRLPPGGFLTAVLQNRLFDAVARADKEHLAALGSIVQFIYNEVPSDAWGSDAAVRSWLQNNG